MLLSLYGGIIRASDGGKCGGTRTRSVADELAAQTVVWRCHLILVNMPPTWEWSNELTLKFLKHLSKENVLWDRNDPRHKEKYKVQEAWDRLSTAMGMPVDELKMKKTSLMASWRPLVRKKVASIESATHEDEIFQPSWFAYDVMERFLGKLYGIEQTVKPEYDVSFF